jgi:hypothetical protein
MSSLPGLDAAIMTCQDYLEELRAIAQPRVHAMFCDCILEHLVCCIAARMLCSAHPYNIAWQKGIAIEMSRLQIFAQSQLHKGQAVTDYHLSMLSILRALLCAPDAFSITASYSTVRPLCCVYKAKASNITEASYQEENMTICTLCTHPAVPTTHVCVASPTQRAFLCSNNIIQ